MKSGAFTRIRIRSDHWCSLVYSRAMDDIKATVIKVHELQTENLPKKDLTVQVGDYEVTISMYYTIVLPGIYH